MSLPNTILIADDEPGVRHGFERLLRALGYLPQLAADGEQALEMIRREPPDLLLCDVRMPRMDGPKLLGSLKAEGLLERMPTIMISGVDETAAACRCFELGAEDYLVKPVNRALLGARIAACLHKKRLQDELRLRLAHLESLYGLLPDTTVATLDAELRLLELNPLGRARPEAAATLGRPVRELLDALAPGAAAGIYDLLRGGRPIVNAYVESRRTDEAALYLIGLAPVDAPPPGGALTGARWILTLRRLETTARKAKAAPGDEPFHGIVGHDPAIVRVCDLVRRVAPLPSAVLIAGPTGVGKELVARAIHAESRRAAQPFIAVNCTALSHELLESELFGHVRGAFTGAIAARKGRFREADGGTLFLDEIGDTSESFQGKLLRVLEDGQLTPVGQDRPVAVDARIVCATNKDLAALVRAGRFREDLYYRINVVAINMPPLAERLGDVPLLVEHFCREFGQRLGRPHMAVSGEAMRVLMGHRWPGNVRELRHVLERAFVVAEGAALTTADLPASLLEPPLNAPPPPLPPAGAGGGHGPAVAPDFSPELLMDEGRRIEFALVKAGGNLTRAARLLNVHRTTLWRKLRDHRIDVDGLRPAK